MFSLISISFLSGCDGDAGCPQSHCFTVERIGFGIRERRSGEAQVVGLPFQGAGIVLASRSATGAGALGFLESFEESGLALADARGRRGDGGVAGVHG